MVKGIAGGNGNGGARKTGAETETERAAAEPSAAAANAGVSKGVVDFGAGRTVTVDVSLRIVGGVYASNRIDVHLSPRQALAYRAIYDAAILDRAMLANGHYVGNQQVDAIRWLLDRIADEAGL